MFQWILFLLNVAAVKCYMPLVQGIVFLEREPKQLKCFKYHKWMPCNKEEICRDGLQFLIDKTEPEFLDNWVQKFGMLCEPKSKVGLLGSIYFVGMLFGLAFVPTLSDKYGRRWPFLATMILSFIAQAGLMITNNLNIAICWMFLIGCTFAGKNIVGLNYLLEFIP
jgi:hypothetical protein